MKAGLTKRRTKSKARLCRAQSNCRWSCTKRNEFGDESRTYRTETHRFPLACLHAGVVSHLFFDQLFSRAVDVPRRLSALRRLCRTGTAPVSSLEVEVRDR